MPDATSPFALSLLPTPSKPLMGLTMLVVEDSRYACEALRLLCLYSGARLRRADCLASAHRHLGVYRPDVLIVDLGLPDGPGEGLIHDLARRPQRPSVLVATSGDPLLGPAAMAAGADGFLEKPIDSLRHFQCTILSLLPLGPGESSPRPACQTDTALTPDPIALRDDLAHAAVILSDHPDAHARNYVSQFLAGVARSAHDPQLADADSGLAQRRSDAEGETGKDAALGRVARLVQARLEATGPLWTPPKTAAPPPHLVPTAAIPARSLLR